MYRLKFILSVVIGAAALLVLLVAVFWRSLLTPEQKLRYGLVFSAADDFAARAAAHPEAGPALADYADALAREGNLGRAAYLADLYGADSELLSGLREVVRKSLAAADAGEVYASGSDPAVQAVQELPVREALRYLEGYRHALLGDWASAKNYFAALKEKQLAPVLRPYYRYYLARCYRLAGDAEQKGQVEALLQSVVKAHPDPELEARARYNLIALYLSADYGGNGLAAAKDQQLSLALAVSSWAKQKALVEFGAYYLRLGQPGDAWPLAQDALTLAPEAPAGEGAATLGLDLLEGALEPESALLDAKGQLLLPLQPGTALALAKASVRHGFSVRCAKLLGALKSHLSERALWEELYIAQARCYSAEADLPRVQQLLAQANLQNFGDPALAQLYFDYAALLAARQQWNQALGYYRSSAKLGGPQAESGGAGEAYFRCYAILKHVQEPLNQQAALELLRTVVEQYEDSRAYGRAVEELIPLLLNAGSADAARRLCDHVLKHEAAQDADAQAQQELARLKLVAQYWSAYLDNKAGRPVDQAVLDASFRYFSYYELALNPQLKLPEGTGVKDVLARPEAAAEYFAGLGLDGLSDNAGDESAVYDPVGGYLDLANAEHVKPLSTRQWEATELLESGRVADAALLRYVLDQAYPRPYAKEVAAAAARFKVPPALLYAVIKKESSFKEDAQSGVGAQGLMQLMPPTAQWLTGLYALPPETYARRTEPASNILLGAAYLASLYEDLGLAPGQGGDDAVRQVLHCYNGGPANYAHWRGLYPNASGALLTELIPNDENEVFAKKVWKYYKLYGWLEGQ